MATPRGPPAARRRRSATSGCGAIHVASYDPEGYTRPGFVDALRRAEDDGATVVYLRPLLNFGDAESTEIAVNDDSPTHETLATGLQVAEREGLQTVVQPYIEMPDFYAGEYDPPDHDAFFASYGERIAAYADLAGENGAEAFVVGSLFSLLDGPEHTERWTALLNDTRERCGCQVTYSAENVEGAERVQFWPAADYIGISQLEALADEPSEDAATLTEAWAPFKERMEVLANRWDKPVAIVELGYESKDDQASANAFGAEGDPSESTQAALYEAAFRAFRDTPWFAGIGWFELNGDGGQPEADDYGFAGKQAEEILRAWQTAR